MSPLVPYHVSSSHTAVQLTRSCGLAGTLGMWQGHMGFQRCSLAEARALEQRIVMPEDEAHLLKLVLGQPAAR